MLSQALDVHIKGTSVSQTCYVQQTKEVKMECEIQKIVLKCPVAFYSEFRNRVSSLDDS